MNKESFKYENDTLHFKLGRYGNGVLAVQLLDSDDSPYCTLSVNLEDAKPSEGCFWLKDWSENADIAAYLQEQGLIELTGREIKTGFVSSPEARITQKGLTASLKKEGATYDSWETDQIMTDELSHRDDYGERSKGQYFRDYPEQSSDVRPPARPQHQQEQWNTKSPQSKTLAEYFKQWAKDRWEKIQGVGKELQEGGHPFDPSLSEGYWNKPLPYVGTEGTPTSFMMMPAMKEGKLSSKDVKMKNNELGGLDYEDASDIERAKSADLLTLPKDVKGTNCSNCKFVKLPEKFCNHPKVQLPVTERMCCAFWDNLKAERQWTGGQITKEAESDDAEEVLLDLDLEWQDFITRDPKIKQETKDAYIKYTNDGRLKEIYPRKLQILRRVFPEVENLEKYREGPDFVCECTHRKSEHSDIAPHPCEADLGDVPCDCKALRQKSLSGYKDQISKEAINMYGDHNVEITFEFTQDEIKVMCTWEKGDLPKGLDEAQTLARIVQFLEKKLPPTFDRFKHIRLTDVDLVNRTISFEMPTTSLRME